MSPNSNSYIIHRELEILWFKFLLKVLILSQKCMFECQLDRKKCNYMYVCVYLFYYLNTLPNKAYIVIRWRWTNMKQYEEIILDIISDFSWEIKYVRLFKKKGRSILDKMRKYHRAISWNLWSAFAVSARNCFLLKKLCTHLFASHEADKHKGFNECYSFCGSSVNDFRTHINFLNQNKMNSSLFCFSLPQTSSRCCSAI